MISRPKLVTLLSALVAAVALGAQAAAAASPEPTTVTPAPRGYAVGDPRGMTPAPRVNYPVGDPRLYGALTPEPRLFAPVANPRVSYPRFRLLIRRSGFQQPMFAR